MSAHGSPRQLRSGEVLCDSGDRSTTFAVVTGGQIEIVQPSGVGDTVITALRPGQFTGEANMLSGPAIAGAGSSDRVERGHPADARRPARPYPDRRQSSARP